MLKYIFKRILLFIPSLFIISLLVFGLSNFVGGDIYEDIPDDVFQEDNIKRRAAKYNYDKPNFYVSFTSAAYPDSLYLVLEKNKRTALEQLIAQYGNWPAIDQYKKAVAAFTLKVHPDKIADTFIDSLSVDAQIDVYQDLALLPVLYEDRDINDRLENIEKLCVKHSKLNTFVHQEKEKVLASYQKIKEEATTNKLYIPSLRWNGTRNRYHHWATNFLGLNDQLGFKKTFPFINWQPDFGYSLNTGKSVNKTISDALFWTLILNLSAIFLAFLLAIPLGIYSAVKNKSKSDRMLTVLVFMLYSLPNFWIAILLISFFTTTEYCSWCDIFPPSTSFSGLSPDASWWQYIPKLILPILCMVYPSLAFISRQMRGGMLEVLQQDYIQTARAKGLSEGKVIGKHALRNGIFPIITLVAGILPAAVGGSVIIEQIFGIPGMGRLMLLSIHAEDWPVVYIILMLASVLTMIGILLADILYALVDPRVSFK